jgi:hypothetical protein
LTIQNWLLAPDGATIVCDTLSTAHVQNVPSAFMSKAWVVPHLSVMIAGLDWAYPSLTLYSHLAMGFEPFGPDGLIGYARGKLQQAVATLPDHLPEYPSTRTVMFVWDADRNQIDGWLFRADRDFAPEQMPHGLTLSPPPQVDVDGMNWYGVVLQQQKFDQECPPDLRGNIGGSLMRYEMRVDPAGRPPAIIITNHGTLPHFDEQASQVAAFHRKYPTEGMAAARA